MTVLWGIDSTNAQTVEAGLNAPAGDALFAAADSGGAEVAVAYVKDGLLTVEFLDEQALASAARPRTVLTPAGLTLTEVDASASGVVGFAVGWADATGGDPMNATLSAQYFGLAGAYGAPVSIGTGHGLEIAGYELLDTAGKKPVADGFEAAWIQDGVVKFQRFAVWLDLAKDPTGAVMAAGRDGVPQTLRPVDDLKSTDPSNTDAGGVTSFSAGGVATDVSLTVTHDGESVLAWTETTALGATSIKMMVLNRNGSANTSVHGAGGLPVTVDATGIPAGAHVETAWLAAGGFVVAWTQGTEIHAKVYSPTGGTPGTGATFAAGPEVTLLNAGAGFDGTFSVTTMLDAIGGFSVSFTSGTEVKAASFNSAGGPMDAAPITVATIAAGSDVATASLAGERVLVLTEAGGGVQSAIIDPRGAVGQTLTGTDTPTKPIADIVVGTVGDDTIDGGASADIMDGGMGNDLIVAGAGDDVIDGGGGVDTVLFSGNRADYNVTDLGGGLFQVIDQRGIDGADMVRGAEVLQFADIALDIGGVAGEGEYVTPTAWGLSDTDTDLLPADTRTPDVDGFIVNSDTPADRAGRQSAPVVSDSVGEFVAILWETETATGSRIKASFLDVLGAPDTGTPLPDNIFLTDGIGIETKPVVAGGGGAAGWGFVFSEVQPEGHEILKTNFIEIGLTGTEQLVDTQSGMHFHDASVFGSFLDRRLVDGVVVDARPAAMNDGYSVVYVASAIDGTGAFDPVYGEVRIQRFEVPLDAAGAAGTPVAGGIDGMAGVRDGSVVDATDDAPYVLAAHGRSPSVTALHTFETVAVWIENVGGVERVAGTAIDDVGGIIPVDMSNISAGDVLAAGAGVTVVSAGAVNAAVVWVAMVDGQAVLRSTMFSSPGAGFDGLGFDLGAPAAPFTLMDLPAGVDLSSIKVTGISGEDSNDLVVQWETGTGDGRDIYARHFSVTLDPATGVALAMRPNGDAVMVHSIADGEQSHGGVAGLLGDRFISVWAEHNPAIADGASDIVARIFDTRAPGQEIIGDLMQAGGPQARRDIIVGTIGNDTIQGDISDADGLVDQLFGGMGDDILIGGPGLKGAAGSPELIDGGEGTDTAVYTGNLSDYTITAIFDPQNGAGFEIRDNRAVQDANGNPAQHDGVDNVFNVEILKFADVTLTVAEDTYLPPAPAPLAGWDGTPTAWSLTDEGVTKTIDLGTPAAESGIVVTNLQDDAAMLWVQDGTHLMAVRQDITGVVDPLWAMPGGPAGAIEMTDGSFAANTVSDAAVGMAGGLGLIGAWTSTDALGNSAIHLRYGSTATDTPFDGGAAGFPAYGWAGGEVVVAGSAGGSHASVKGYEIVDAANDTVEVGFHVAFVVGGEIRLARYEIPVWDVDPATGARIAPSSPATFGTGAETEPRLLNADGTRAFDLLGNQIDADAGALVSVGAGSNPTLASLHDGELVVGYVDGAGQMAVKVIDLATDTATDRGAGAGGTTAYGYGTAASFAYGADVQQGMVVAQQNGSFGVFWTEGTGTQTVKAVIFTGAAPSVELVLGTIPAGAALQVVPSGVDPITGAEDGFVVFWQDGDSIGGQRYDMQGAAVGSAFTVDAGGTHSAISAAGIDNGLLIVGHDSGDGDVGVNYLDTRQPGVATLGPRTGAPRDVAVGTTGDDAMDGRARDDMMFAGLGNDVITLGIGNDLGDGGAGADTILGGDGQDVLIGGAGDDLLLPGMHGPAAPALNRDINDGLAANGVSAAVIASNTGADLVSGGDGIDTLSFRQEWTAVRVDLEAGLAFRQGAEGTGLPQFTDGGETASWMLGAVIGTVTPDLDPALPATFALTHDIENIEGSRANDVLLGDGGANTILTGGGDDFVDGRGGDDIIVLGGPAAQYFLAAQPDGSVTLLRFVPVSLLQPDGMEVVRAVSTEYIQFTDRTVRAVDVLPEMTSGDLLPAATTGPYTQTDVASVLEDGSVIINVLANDSAGPGGGALHVSQVGGLAIAAGETVAVTNGHVTLNANGTLTFVPGADYSGTVSFSYRAADGNGNTAPGTVNVAVTPVADAPRPEADAFTATQGKTLLLDVLANDVNPDAPAPMTLRDVHVVSGTGVTATVVDNVISFSAAVAGLVKLSYTVGVGAETATTTVDVMVEANLNTAPVLTGDLAATVDEGGSYVLTTADLAATDADGDPVTFTISGVSNGTVLVNGSAATSFTAADTVTFRHDGSETTTAGFDVTASDGTATTAAQHFSVSVTPVNDAPILSGAGAPVTYVENAVSLLITPALTLGDVDSGTLTSARVEIAAPRPEDRLVVANWRPENGQTTTMGNITLLYNNGVLLLTGLASLAEYQGVLRLVGYANASDRPDTAPRSITVTVNDGGAENATASTVATVNVTPTDDAASGWVAVLGANGAGAQAVLNAGAALVDADLAGPVAPSFVWSSSTTLGGTATDIGTGASLTVPTAAGPRYVTVDATYTDEFGTHRIDGTGVALVGTGTADTLSTAGVDFVLGLGGNDQITLAAGSKAGLVIDGGSGTDTLTVSAGVAAYGPTSDAALTRVENVTIASTTGTALNLSTQTEAFTITGGTGADTVTGGTGADRVNGGAGNDLFLSFAGDGSDSWAGGAGSDTISFDGVAAAVNIDLSRGTARSATTGSDTLTAIENATGGMGNDTITGSTIANWLEGGSGNDLIRGGDGNDTVKGGSGNDRLFGDNGLDVLTGGDGNDNFCFSGPGGGTDIITDFQPGDRLEITASNFLRGLTNAQIANGNWFWQGVSAHDLDDRLIYNRDTGYLIYDSNGNRDGGTIVNIAHIDTDNDLSNGFNDCNLNWLDFIIT